MSPATKRIQTSARKPAPKESYVGGRNKPRPPPPGPRRSNPNFPHLDLTACSKVVVYRLVVVSETKAPKPVGLAYRFDPFTVDFQAVGEVAGGGWYRIQWRSMQGHVIAAEEDTLEGPQRQLPEQTDPAVRGTAMETANAWMFFPNLPPEVNAVMVHNQMFTAAMRQLTTEAKTENVTMCRAILETIGAQKDQVAGVMNELKEQRRQTEKVVEQLTKEIEKSRAESWELKLAKQKLELTKEDGFLKTTLAPMLPQAFPYIEKLGGFLKGVVLEELRTDPQIREMAKQAILANGNNLPNRELPAAEKSPPPAAAPTPPPAPDPPPAAAAPVEAPKHEAPTPALATPNVENAIALFTGGAS